MSDDITTLKHEIDQIKSRNRRVELEKKWETSFARKICLAIVTYLIIGLYMRYVLDIAQWYIDALVPTLGFLIGSWGFGWAKRIWMRNQK